MKFPSKVRTCLWFESDGEAAAEHYVSLIPDSRVESVFRPDPAGGALVVEYSLAGAPFMHLNGGPMFKLSPAASISVLTEDQAETDALWTALLADGGAESHCGWLADRFGVSWQVVPKPLLRMLTADDRQAAGRGHQTMMEMVKLDIATLEAAFRGA